jgi:uncharacterized membrane protein
MTEKQRILYFLLIFVKISLGLIFIERLSIDLDEPFSIFHAQKDWHDLNKLFLHENNPPLHFWLLHLWIKLFGIEPWAVRSLSLIFSLLTIPVLLNIGKQIKNTNAGLMIVTLFVFSNFHHSYAMEARTYALFSFLFSLALFFLLRLQEQKNWINTLFFSISLVSMFYAHYIAVIVVPVFLLVFFVSILKNNLKRNMFYVLASLLIFILLSFPILKPFINRLNHVNDEGTWVPKPHWTELYGFVNKFMNGPGFLAVLLIFLTAIFILKHRNKLPELKTWISGKVGLVLLFSLMTYFGAFVVSLWGTASVFLDRYLFFLSIAFFTLLAWFIETVRERWNYKALIPLIAVVFGFNPLKTHNRASDELVQYAKHFDGTYIITPPFYDLTFLYYYNRKAFTEQLEKQNLNAFNIYPIYDLSEIDLEKVRKPIILIDAASRFLYGEQKLKEELMNFFSVKSVKIFPGEYEVIVFE